MFKNEFVPDSTSFTLSGEDGPCIYNLVLSRIVFFHAIWYSVRERSCKVACESGANWNREQKAAMKRDITGKSTPEESSLWSAVGWHRASVSGFDFAARVVAGYTHVGRSRVGNVEEHFR